MRTAPNRNAGSRIRGRPASAPHSCTFCSLRCPYMQLWAVLARYDNPPVFSSAERKRFLDFSRSVMDAVQGLRSPTRRIGFLLAYGYFRSPRRFFPAERYHERDIAFFARVVGDAPDASSAGGYRQRTRLHHQGFRSPFSSALGRFFPYDGASITLCRGHRPATLARGTILAHPCGTLQFLIRQCRTYLLMAFRHCRIKKTRTS